VVTPARAAVTVTAVFLAFLAGPGVLAARSAAAVDRPDDGLPPLRSLAAGREVVFQHNVPINIVLVGYDKTAVGAGIRSQLPRVSEPIVRWPRFLGAEARDVGLRFTYRYHLVDAPRSFEDNFFRWARKSATKTRLTLYQEAYNFQQSNILDIPQRILTLDAPATERYLETAASDELGLTANSGYTVFLVNWWGRSDFRFHVYRAADSPDPDTRSPIGLEEERAIIAWGGSSHARGWFYDLSAGPEYNTANWYVDARDFSGNDIAEYRMPPVWEYADGGYGATQDLGEDLGRVVRNVALNLLFTSSPLYDPLVLAPDPSAAVHVRINVLEGDPATSGQTYLKPDLTQEALEELAPYFDWETDVAAFDPMPGEAAQALALWNEVTTGPGCWESYGHVFAQLFCYFDQHRSQYLPDGNGDYVEGVFAFNTTDEAMGTSFGLLGLADDNWTDGAQSFAYVFSYPYTKARVGLTRVTAHEVAHHLGLSHPHDGYDFETDIDYEPIDDYWYAWIGDESNTQMSYLKLTDDFGAFDQDNLARYEFAGYVNWANAVLGELQGEALSSAERRTIRSADREAGRAMQHFSAWRYMAAAESARNAWAMVQSVATSHGIVVDAAPSQLSIAATTPPEGDPLEPARPQPPTLLRNGRS
jgi:hypothetical protein